LAGHHDGTVRQLTRRCIAEHRRVGDTDRGIRDCPKVAVGDIEQLT
jgi:hypothetical protein